MKLQKKYILPVAAFAIAASVFTLSSVAKADTINSQDSLVQKLVTKFNLNETEVKQVVDEHRDQMHKERAVGHETNLQKLVDEGKLTQAQKDTLVTKMQDKAKFGTMSAEERQKAHETHRTEMDKWFAEQGIDKNLLKLMSHGGQGRSYHDAK
jgi:polyhydroxyalkanoate synthesis regulator phasin